MSTQIKKTGASHDGHSIFIINLNQYFLVYKPESRFSQYVDLRLTGCKGSANRGNYQINWELFAKIVGSELGVRKILVVKLRQSFPTLEDLSRVQDAKGAKGKSK